MYGVGRAVHRIEESAKARNICHYANIAIFHEKMAICISLYI